MNPACQAAWAGDLSSLSAMSQTADVAFLTSPTAFDSRGFLPIHYAASLGLVDLVAFLVSLCPHAVNFQDRTYGNSPLHFAIEGGHFALVQLLVKSNAWVDQSNFRCMTPLMLAIEMQQVEIASFLCYAGANVLVAAQSGETSLHAAASLGSAPLVSLLLKFGGFPNAKDEAEETPLHHAARSGNADCVQLLLDAGADKNARNVDGDTPVDVARLADCVESNVSMNSSSTMVGSNVVGDHLVKMLNVSEPARWPADGATRSAPVLSFPMHTKPAKQMVVGVAHQSYPIGAQ